MVNFLLLGQNRIFIGSDGFYIISSNLKFYSIKFHATQIRFLGHANNRRDLIN